MSNMKNADKPITPVEKIVEFGDGRIEKSMYLGLTKREYFASMAMQGLLASNSRIRVCETAILYADELLKQLSNEQ